MSTPSGQAPSPSVTTVLKRLILPVYAPSFISAAGGSAVFPVLPLIAISLDFSTAAAALLTTIYGVLAVAGPIPIGFVMDRIGERTAMIAGAAVSIVASAGALVLLHDGASQTTRLLLLVVLVVDAVAMEIWDLGRHTYLSAELPTAMRGRAMNIFGGMMRLGRVVGPALGAGALTLLGFSGVYWLRMALMLIAAVMVMVFVSPHLGRPEAGQTTNPDAIGADTRSGTLLPHVVKAMVLVATGASFLIVCRVNVVVLVPLIGNHIGLSPAVISLVFAATTLLEIVLFLPSGILLDRWGRAICGAICSFGMGAGFMLFVLAGRVDGALGLSPLVWYVIASQVIALGNVMGSGIVKTLGVDLAPSYRRSAHLGLFNSLVGLGQLGGPVVASAVTAAASLTAAAVATGGIGLIGAAVCLLLLPKYTPGWQGRQPDFHPDQVPTAG